MKKSMFTILEVLEAKDAKNENVSEKEKLTQANQAIRRNEMTQNEELSRMEVDEDNDVFAEESGTPDRTMNLIVSVAETEVQVVAEDSGVNDTMDHGSASEQLGNGSGTTSPTMVQSNLSNLITLEQATGSRNETDVQEDAEDSGVNVETDDGSAGEQLNDDSGTTAPVLVEANLRNLPLEPAIGARISSTRQKRKPNRFVAGGTGRQPQQNKTPTSYRPQATALASIRPYQHIRRNGLIPLLPFHKLVKEITLSLPRGNQLKYQGAALAALRGAAEAYCISLFEDSYLLTLHAKRVTIRPEDIRLALRIRGQGQIPA